MLLALPPPAQPGRPGNRFVLSQRWDGHEPWAGERGQVEQGDHVKCESMKFDGGESWVTRGIRGEERDYGEGKLQRLVSRRPWTPRDLREWGSDFIRSKSLDAWWTSSAQDEEMGCLRCTVERLRGGEPWAPGMAPEEERQHGDLQSAEWIYKDVLADNPTDNEALVALANIKYEKDQNVEEVMVFFCFCRICCCRVFVSKICCELPQRCM